MFLKTQFALKETELSLVSFERGTFLCKIWSACNGKYIENVFLSTTGKQKKKKKDKMWIFIFHLLPI